MHTVIEVRDLQKTYKPKRGQHGPEVRAVDGIAFEVARGEFFGLLGPNGAGKTTTIGILTTRVRPTGGAGMVASLGLAKKPVAVKARLRVVPQKHNPGPALR